MTSDTLPQVARHSEAVSDAVASLHAYWCAANYLGAAKV